MSWQHLSDTHPKARKPYRCHVCATDILTNEKHVARRGIDDYGPCTVRMHLDCEEVTRKWDDMDWECHFPGDFERPKRKERA